MDSYRAIVLRPDWEKPYYRCSEAWLLLGNHATALKINEMGCERCNLKADLSRQRSDIVTAMEREERWVSGWVTSNTVTVTPLVPQLSIF